MANAQLPDCIRPVYGRILRKYKVAFDTLKLGETQLHLLQVTDIEPLLKGKDPFHDVSSFPFWVKLWESSMVLAALLAKMPPQAGQTLLELGAGLAAPGLAAAQAGYRVTLSDYEQDILDFARVNAAVNNMDNVDFKVLDWKNPPDLGRFDIIVGAEILFREEFFEPLLAVFDRMLAPDGTIYLSHDMRRKSLPQFLKLAEKQYEIAISTRKMRSAEEILTVIVNRLRRRA